jgi:hypothetical protein
VRLQPYRLLLADPKSAEAKRPRKVEICDRQIVETGGIYMFTVKTNQAKRKILLTVGVMTILAFILWPVWPLRLRAVTWYACYAIILSSVSSVHNSLGLFLADEILGMVYLVPHRH